MDKVLRLYRLPAQESLLKVIADSTTPPTVFKDGDYYMNHVSNTLYIANGDSDSGGTWFLIIMPQTTSRYYYVKDSNPLSMWRYINSQFVEYDCSFPSNRRDAVIYDFTYNAQRMGGAHTISATLMYDECLDNMWSHRVCCMFNGTFFFIDKTPQSSKSNTDARYKHDITLVSDMVLLENVYFLNIADPTQDEDYVNDWYTFNFFGGISEFVERLNRSMVYSQLSYAWIGYRITIDTDTYTSNFISEIENEERIIEIDKTYIKDALDMIYDTWGVPYYFDGYDIHIGFSNRPLAEAEGVDIPTIEYGFENELLNITKGNSNENIVNRITGHGSSENVPYFYPNDNPNALELKYRRNGSIIQDAAKIVNPYKTSRLTASQTPVQLVPSGSYFQYTSCREQYHLAQEEIVNGIYISDIGTGTLKPKTNEDIFFKVTVNRMSDNTVKIIKDVFFWIGDSDYNDTSVEFSDFINAYSTISLTAFLTLSFFSKIGVTFAMLNKDREWFDDLHSAYNHGNYPSMTYGSPEMFTDTYHTGYPNIDGVISGMFDDDGYFHANTPISWHGHISTPYWENSPSTTSYNERFSRVFENISSSKKILFCRINMFVTTYNNYTSYLAPIFDSLLLRHSSTKCTTTKSVLKWNDGQYPVSLYNYGIKTLTEPVLGDIIFFTSEGVLDYMTNIMPPILRSGSGLWYNAYNRTYPKGQSYYSFKNTYVYSHAKEHIEDFEDIKPTIEGIRNSDTPSRRIDMFRDITFDAQDDGSLNENGVPNNPYFYVKLAKTNSANGFGFNLFDCGIDSGEMTVNITSGHCGGCSFKVMVKRQTDGRSVNTIGLFEEDTTIGGVTYPAGTPKRDQNGNVLINQYDEVQQDTSANEVWIALLKDNETFQGQTLPIKGLLEPTTSDTFVLTNISLPFAYIDAAEKKLEKALLDYMEQHNAEKFTFTVNFSRIFYENNYQMMDRWVNEASRFTIRYNSTDFDYFAKSYTYKMLNSSHLPEVSITFEQKSERRLGLNQRINRISLPSETNEGELNAITGISEMSIQGSSSWSFNGSIHANGGVFIEEDISVKRLIDSSNNEIETSRTMKSAYSDWLNVAERVELHNLFKDGEFRYGYNAIEDFSFVEIKPSDTSFSDSELGNGKELVFLVESISSSVNSISFGQKVHLYSGRRYSIVFDGKYTPSESENELDAYVRVLTMTGTSSQDEEITIPVMFSEGWKKYAVSFNISYECDIEVSLDFYINTYESEFKIGGMMVLEGDFAAYVDDTYTEPTSMTPKKFIPHMDDVSIAVTNNSSDKHFEYTWDVPVGTIRINHNMNKFPSVIVIDTSGDELIGDLTYIDENNLTITFSDVVIGTAYLN